MNKEMVMKKVANKFVDMAVQTSKVSSNVCLILFGEPKTTFELHTEDFEGLLSIRKQKNL